MTRRAPALLPHEPRRYRRWTAADDHRLRRLWGEGTIEATAKALGRSAITTYWRGRKLALPCGVPQGHEYLAHAARRTGFTTGQLRTLLPKSTVRRTVSAPGRGAKRSYHCVLPDHVDAAVARWGRTELVHRAAAARDLNGETLRRWLIAAGEKPPRGAKRRWRVPTKVIDRVVAAALERHALLSVSAHARRLGVSRSTLAQHLRRAGLLGAKRPGNAGLTRLPAAAVDAVAAQIRVGGWRPRRAA